MPKNIDLYYTTDEHDRSRVAEVETCLVHTSIGEEKCGILIRDRGRGGDVGVLLGFEVVEELFADALRSPSTRHPGRSEAGDESCVPRCSNTK